MAKEGMLKNYTLVESINVCVKGHELTVYFDQYTSVTKRPGKCSLCKRPKLKENWVYDFKIVEVIEFGVELRKNNPLFVQLRKALQSIPAMRKPVCDRHYPKFMSEVRKALGWQ